MQRKWRGLARSSCAGRVHVEPRPVHRQHRLPGDRASTSAAPRSSSLSWVLSALRDRVRRAARPGRALGRRVRAQARVPARPRRVRRSPAPPARAAPSVGVLVAARVVQAAGGALMLPTSLGLMLPEFEPERAPRRDRRVGGDRRHRRGRRPAARRPARAGRLAARCSSSTSRSGCRRSAVGVAHAARAPRAATPARPDVLGARDADRRRSARSSWRSSRARTGAGARRACSRCSPSPRVLLPALWRRSERHAAPVVEPAMLRVRSFGAGRRRARCCSSPASARCCSRGVLFLTGVWHEDVLTAGPDAVPGPGDGDRVQHPLGAPRRALRLPRCRASPARCCSRAGSVWYITQTGDTPALRLASSCPAIADRRRRRRPRDPDADRRRRLLARARALRDRRGGADDGPPDRRRRSASRCSSPCSARREQRRRLPLGLADHRRRRPRGRRPCSPRSGRRAEHPRARGAGARPADLRADRRPR